MSKRILITNDDGIGADGIRKLAEIARRFGEVTVVAPDAQRSAASHHCIFSKPLILKEYDFGPDGIRAYTLDGTPADCVRVGIFAAMDRKPDIVLSGINHGYNISSDIQYSGTVGADPVIICNQYVFSHEVLLCVSGILFSSQRSVLWKAD